MELQPADRSALAAALRQERRGRVWRRLRAVQLLAAGEHPQAVAQALGCSLASVDNWATAWRTAQRAGLADGTQTGRARRLDAAAEALLAARLQSDPPAHGQPATGWTVPLLRQELAAAGYAVSERTIRRSLRGLKWRWKRPKDVLGWPDPASAEKGGP